MKYSVLLENWNKFLNEEDLGLSGLSTTTTTTADAAKEASIAIDKSQTQQQKKDDDIEKAVLSIAADANSKIKSAVSANSLISKEEIKTDLIAAIQQLEEEKKKAGDRCTRIAKRKYKVWPSAYASGAVVKCRQGKIWKGISESVTDEEIDEALLLEEQIEEAKKRDYKPNFSKEKKQGLHGWFARNKGKGWVNCRTGGPCGRSDADKEGGKYPACRPTKSQCKSAGKGPLRRKKSSKPISWTKKKKKD